MDNFGEINAIYKHKKQLEERLETLKEEVREAEAREQECQMRCEQENLDIRKFEGSDFRQFWFKVRGQYESKVLENNEKAAEAMRALNDAKSHVFDVTKEKEDVERQLKALEGVDEAYDKAFTQHVEHLDYSIHREEIMRMQEKIAQDDHQLSLLAEARNLAQVAVRKEEVLKEHLQTVSENNALSEAGQDKVEIQVISGFSEIRIQLHRLEQTLASIDAWETESLSFTDKISVNTLDLFYYKGSDELQKLALEKALYELDVVKDNLVDCENTIMHLVVDVEETKHMHQEQLQAFIVETEI